LADEEQRKARQRGEDDPKGRCWLGEKSGSSELVFERFSSADMPTSLGRFYGEAINQLRESSAVLSQDPESSALFALRLYPLSVERRALIGQFEYEEDYGNYVIKNAYEEEVERVEEEWRVGREKVKERLLEGIEERRRRAREEKDGEGITGTGKLIGP
jgi:hypothetical protein